MRNVRRPTSNRTRYPRCCPIVRRSCIRATGCVRPTTRAVAPRSGDLARQAAERACGTGYSCLCGGCISRRPATRARACT